MKRYVFLLATLSLSLCLQPLRAAEILVIGDSWAEPIGAQLRNVLAENGHEDIPVYLTPYWGGPKNFNSPGGFEALSGWLEQWPGVTHLYMMMGQNNWLCCWDDSMIGSQREAELFSSIVDHTEAVVSHILSIRPGLRIVWTAGEYFRPHHLGTPAQLNANHDRLAQFAADFAGGLPELTFLNWNGLFQVTYGFDGIPYTEFDPPYAIPPGDPSLPDPSLPSPYQAYPDRRPAHPTEAGYKVMAQALYDRYFSAELDSASFTINAGLSDAWYDPVTAGQGFLITVFPDREEIFLAWFTYDTERPAAGVSAQLGEPGQRWLTAQGSYADNQAVLDIWVSSGGVFDSAQPAVTREMDGQIILEFSSCSAGTVSYDIHSVDRQRVIPIERVAPDRVALCEALANTQSRSR
jgi:hypothetical protein